MGRCVCEVRRARTVTQCIRRVHATQRLQDGPVQNIDKRIAALAIPALGALALDPLLSIVDTAFVGRLGVEAIGALGVASIILNISFSIFNFLAMATTPLIAAAVNDTSVCTRERTSRVIVSGLYLSTAIGSVSSTILLTSARRICIAVGATAASLPYAVAYLRARAIASPFTLISFVANGAFRGFQDTRTPFLIALCANSLNLILDPLLIFVAKLGVTGAALATSISQVIAVLLMVFMLIRSKRLRVRDLLKPPSISEILPLLRAGAMLTIRTMSILGTVAYATSTAAHLGTVQLAAYELCRQLWVFHAMVLDSLAAAAQALVASALARGAYLQARFISNRTMRLGAFFGLLIAAAAFMSGTSLPRVFTNSPQVVSVTADCIRMAALCAPLNGAIFALDGVLAASRDYSYMALAIALAGTAAISTLMVVRHYGAGVVAVWAGLNVLMLARATVLFLRYFSRHGPLPPERFLLAKEGSPDNHSKGPRR